MDKLRTSYKKYQSEILATKPRFVNSEKSGKLSSLADGEIQKMRARQDYVNYDEAIFYKQKFSKLRDIALNFQTKQISEQNYHRSARQAVRNDFIPNAVRSASNQQVNQNLNIQASNGRSKTKSPLKQFFDEEEIKSSKKVSFSNLLSREETPLKYGLRSVSRPKNQSEIRPKNNDQLLKLEEQNRRLRDQLNNEKNNNPNDDQRLRELKGRIRELDEQNQKLRSQVSKSSRSDFYVEEQYDPYNLKVRQNNIEKIHSKNLYNNQKMSQFSGGGYSEDFPKQKKISQIYYDNQSDYIRSDAPQKVSPTKNRSNNYLEQNQLNESQSSIQTQFLNLQNSQLYDESQNQICRQKIAFFKKSMVIVKTPDFDIAFKRSDFNSQMDRLRLILYVNNKSSRGFNCVIEYDFDHEDFDIIVKKKLTVVEGRSQGRQQIEIFLKSTSELGSLITAKVLVGDKMKKIVVPALFIDFDNDLKYQLQNIGYIERNLAQPLVIKPMSQFLTTDRASNVLELNREYEQKYEVAKMYGKSKACKGMVKLTWKKGNKLKIQTCQEWRILMGYLFLNAEETINY